MLGRVFTAAALLLAASVFGRGASAEDRALKLYNAHTKERATIVFKRDGRYDSAGLAQLNRFLRDWRQNKPIKMDPKLFDLLWEVYRKAGATQPISVVCGYRAPETNAMLRRRSSGVAENSLHTKGKAIDFFIPGVPLAKLRALGLQAQAGGVGYYPSSGSPFVHMDTGSVRHWPRMTRSQLVAVFPNGGTLHIPSDGKPLPGYSQALAAYKARQAKGVLVSWAAGGGGGSVPAFGAEEVASERIVRDRRGRRSAAPPRARPRWRGAGRHRRDGGRHRHCRERHRLWPGRQPAPQLPAAGRPRADPRPLRRLRRVGRRRGRLRHRLCAAGPDVPNDLADAMAARDTTVRPDVSGPRFRSSRPRSCRPSTSASI